MSFWSQISKENPGKDDLRPPLSDAVLASCEARYGVRFPPRLIALLREQNGGDLAHQEFKLKGEDYQVDSFGGLVEEGWNRIEPFSGLFDRLDDAEFLAEFPAELGRPDRMIIFAGYAGHCLYALDYNRPAGNEGPRVLHLDIEGGIEAHEVAGSFDEFLDGHYLGEPTPSVNWDELAAENPILETSVSFQHRHQHGGAPFEIAHRVYRQRNSLVAYTRSNWDGKISLRKATIPLKALEPDFCEIAPLSYAAGSNVFELHLHVDPKIKRVEVEDAEHCGDRWKNTRASLFYDSVHAHDQAGLKAFLKQLFPKYRGIPKSLTGQLNDLLEDLGIE